MGREICDGVIRRNSSPGIERGTLLCTSHCEIDVDGGKYTVLWELTSVKGAPTPLTPQCYVHSSTLPKDKEADTDDSDADEPTVQSLPFKVLGTCYSTSRQEALKRHLSIFIDKTDKSLSNMKHSHLTLLTVMQLLSS